MIPTLYNWIKFTFIFHCQGMKKVSITNSQEKLSDDWTAVKWKFQQKQQRIMWHLRVKCLVMIPKQKPKHCAL